TSRRMAISTLIGSEVARFTVGAAHPLRRARVANKIRDGRSVVSIGLAVSRQNVIPRRNCAILAVLAILTGKFLANERTKSCPFRSHIQSRATLRERCGCYPV